ncbi:redoxin domain-containing protein [Virgibacillus kimchii]
MLNFWGTWCKPCEEKMPYMEELYPKYKEKGIEIIAVSLDSTEFVVERFINKYDLTFPIPHDKTGEVQDLYKVGTLPSSYFIRYDGIIEMVVTKDLRLKRLKNIFRKYCRSNRNTEG